MSNIINRNAIALWMFLFGICCYEAEGTLKTNLMGFKNGSFNIYLRSQPSGILMSGSDIYVPSFDHQVTLIPETFTSVVLSIYSYDLGPDYQLTVEDSDHHKIAIMGTRLFRDEKKSIFSDGKMIIRFRTVGSEDPRHWYNIPKNSFQFTFTSVTDKPCSSEEFACKNGKCILTEYLCDGHNHCGDNSDQKNCAPRRLDRIVSYKSSGAETLWITTISVCAVVLLVIIVVFIGVVVRHSKLKKAASAAQGSANAGSGGNVPLQSVSSSVAHGQAPATEIQASAPPPEVDPPQTVYSRIRNSFRRTKDTVANETPVPNEKTETYQVPSMYPSLDISPSAPEVHGNDNPSFKNEE